MPVTSNQYIQKISSEHPIALWSLDDDAYYIKLMSDTGRDIGNWENINVESITNITPEGITLPNPDKPCTRIVASEVGTLEVNGSAFVKSVETFSSTSEALAISFHLYSYDTDIRFVQLGYEMGTVKTVEAVMDLPGPSSVVYEITNHGFVTGNYITVSGTVPNSGNAGAYDHAGLITKINNNRFYFQSHNIEYDPNFAPNEPGGEAFKGEMVQISPWLGGRSDEWLFLSQTFQRTATNAKVRIKIRYDGDYEKTFLINDLTIGDNSLQFASASSGQTPVTLPSSIATSETSGVLAKDFLSNTNDAYYIVNNNKLCTKNSAIPMIAGSSNTTFLSSNNGGPSLIIPGFGLLNKVGRYKSYNLETFVRISGNTIVPKRIIGPLQSEDGVYINGPSIILKINNITKTAYIGEWFKPMMINLQYTENSVELWVNTEKLITIDTTGETLVFPDKIATSGIYEGKDQDWIGFYSYDELISFEVDTVTIYPYTSNSTIIKRRLLYAQAIKTSALEDLATQRGGSFSNIRYDISGYSKNYIFPTFSKWNMAREINNISIKNNQLCAPEYALPGAELGSKTYTEWLEEQKVLQNEASSFFTLKPNSSYDDIHGYLYLDNLNILNDSLSAVYLVVKKPVSSVNEQRLFTIYDSFSKNYFRVSITGTQISYILNYSGVDKTSIYTTATSTINNKLSVGINLDTLRQSEDSEISEFFKSSNLQIFIGGMVNEDKTFDGYFYSIGLCNLKSASEIESSFNVDGIVLPTASLESNIATYTLLSKNFLNNFLIDISTKSYWESSVFLSNLSAYSEDVLDLDFFQLNIDYPEATTLVDGNFDTSNEYVKSYISFQENGSGLSEVNFSSVQLLPQNKVIDAKTNWINKQYEFTDHSLVYVPSDIDFSEYSVVIHLTIVSNLLTNPIKIKYLELASKTLSSTEPSTVTAESAEKIKHYSLNENGLEDYKNNAGIFITKISSSYLLLNNNSGIKVTNT